MRKRAHKRSIATSIRRSRGVRRTGATLISAMILASAAGLASPAQAAGPTPESLNATYDKVKAALENATKPKASPLNGLVPEPGSPLDESISQLQSDLKEFMPGGKLPAKDPNDPNLINQNPGSVYKSGLNITVAKSVLVAAEASGNPKMSVLLANTQASGDGSATVKVPVGTQKAKNSSGFNAPVMEGDDIVYNVQNSGNTQQTFGASNGSYDGKLPVKVQVQTWVNGTEINPADMVNVSGNVRMTYSFTNMTAEMTRISFKGPDGSLITQEKEIPVPFGGAFIVTLPQQFADVNAPWAEGGVSPAGTTLSGTIMMIPPLGKLTQSVTIEARADGASLPGASFQALPITLTDNGIGKTAYGALPLAGGITNVATAAGAFGKADIIKLQALVMKYGAVAAGISNNYVKPVIQAFQDGAIDEAVAKGEEQLVQLDQGAQAIGQLLPEATMVIKLVDEAVDYAVPLFENNIGNINKLIDLLSKASAMLDSLLPKLQDTIAIIQDRLLPALTKGEKLAKTATKICPPIKAFLDGLGSTEAEIVAALHTVADFLPEPYKTTINNLANDIGTIYGDAESGLGYCVKWAPAVYAALTLAIENIDTIQANLTAASKDLTTLAGYLDTASGYGQEFKALEPAIIKALDNNNCPKTPAGISKCGVMQQLNYLLTLMNQATTAVNTQMVPGLDAVVAYLPAVNKFVGLADTYVPIFGEKIEAMIPKVFGSAESALDKGDAALAKFTSAADKAEITVASYTAQLEIMNARAQSGQGLPAGPAQGANTNLGAYQYQIAGANSQADQTMIMLGIAALLIVLSAAVGTVMYSRNKR